MPKREPLPADLFDAPAGTRQWIFTPPFGADLLTDRDRGMGEVLRPVAERGNHRMFLLNRMAVLWATLDGEEVVKVDILEGHDALEAWITYAWKLPESLLERIGEGLVRGVPVAEGLAAVWPRGHYLTSLHGEGPVRTWVARPTLPYRWGVVRLRVGASEQILGVEVLEGGKGFEAYRAHLRSIGRWP